MVESLYPPSVKGVPHGTLLSAHRLDEPLILPLMADTKTIHPEWAGKLRT